MDYTVGTVSTASITGMIVSAAIAILLPLAALIWWRKRSGAKILSSIIGAVVFVLFVLVLEAAMHQAVLGATGDLITGSVWLYALYGGLAAGIFEETGRFLAMRFAMRKFLDRDNAVMYGIGHGGIEAILLVGVSMISNAVASMAINSGAFQQALAAMEESARQANYAQVSVLWQLKPYMFYMGGIERISAFFLHIGLSLLVYKAVKERKAKFWVCAVAVHFLVDASAVLLNGAIPIPVLEVIVFAETALFWGCLYRLFRNRENTSEA